MEMKFFAIMIIKRDDHLQKHVVPSIVKPCITTPSIKCHRTRNYVGYEMHYRDA